MSEAYYTLVERRFFQRALTDLRAPGTPSDDTTIAFGLFKRRNEPNGINYDEVLAQALELNNTAGSIILFVSPLCTRLEEWTSLLGVVGSGRGGNGINTVCIGSDPSIDSMVEQVLGENFYRRQCLETITRSILQNIQTLPSLKTLEMRVPSVPVTVLSSFLDNAPALFRGFSLKSFACQESDDMPSFLAAVERRNEIKPMIFFFRGFSASTVKLVQLFANRNISFETAESCFLFYMGEEDLAGDVAPRQRMFQLLEVLLHFKFLNVQFLDIQSEQVFNEITRNIPKCATKITIEIKRTDGWTSVVEARRSFLAALKRNVRLLSVDVESPDSIAFLDHTEMRKTQFYTHRNRKFQEWAKNPKTLPKNLWPRALQLAAEAGHEELYRRLLSISSDLGATKRTRKRKRPDRYDPGH